jgi:hypothetical protein
MRRIYRALVLQLLLAAPPVLAGVSQQREQTEPGEGAVQLEYRGNGWMSGWGRDDLAGTGPRMRANRPLIWP